MYRPNMPDDDGETLLVPEGVLRGIDNIANGNTATKEDLRDVLKFGQDFEEGDE